MNNLFKEGSKVNRVTLIESEAPIGKYVRRDGYKGNNAFYSGNGVVLNVANSRDMYDLLTYCVGSHHRSIILGAPEDVGVNEPFVILPKARKDEFGDRLLDGRRVVTRTKDVFKPSKWTMFDKDSAMPLGDWKAYMRKMLPDYWDYEQLVIRSASDRIVDVRQTLESVNEVELTKAFLNDVDPTMVPMSSVVDKKFHTYVSWDVSTHEEMMGIIGLLKRNIQIWQRANDVTLVDTSVFSPERIIYESKPVSYSADHYVIEPDIAVLNSPKPMFNASAVEHKYMH